MAVSLQLSVKSENIHKRLANPFGKTGKADWAINHIRKLYCIEVEIKQKTTEEKQAIRQSQSWSLLGQFKIWPDVYS